MSVHSHKQCLVKKYCFSFLVFHINFQCNDIEVSLTRKSIQFYANSIAVVAKTETFVHVSLTSVDFYCKEMFKNHIQTDLTTLPQSISMFLGALETDS